MIIRAAAAVSLAALATGAMLFAATPAPERASRGDRLAVRLEAPRSVTVEQRSGATSTLVRVPVAALAQR